MKFKISLGGLAILILLFIQANSFAADEMLRGKSLKILNDAALHGKGWERIRAAEALISLNFMTDKIRAAFEDMLKQCALNDPVRIGVLRVLYKTVPDKDKCLSEVREAAFGNISGIRCHAVETLAKLKYKVNSEEEAVVEKYLNSDDELLSAYSVWLLYCKRPENSEAALLSMLKRKEAVFQVTAAYVLKHTGSPGPAILKSINDTVLRPGFPTLARIYLLEILALNDKSGKSKQYKKLLLEELDGASAKELREIIGSLALKDEPALLPLIEKNMDSQDTNLRTAAACAFLDLTR